jgi:HD-GYP domain-containing protein (c-di-GMP phosphodiesterase class II)
MESHDIQTKNFLSQIPWSKIYKNVPQIAGDHHERLNGKGYPSKKPKESIMIQSQIIAIVDMFDALTAKDRPYKPPLSVEKTNQILEEEIKKGGLYKELTHLFINSKLWE